MDQPVTNNSKAPERSGDLLPIASVPDNSGMKADRRGSSRLGLYSLISGLCLLGVDISTTYIPAIAKSNSFAFLDAFNGIMVALCLVCILALAAPSFKKNPYPNLFGLIGLTFSLIALSDFITLLVGTLKN